MFSNANFPSAKTYWHMGKFYSWSEAGLHPMSHALHYGSSTFEGIRAYHTPRGPAVFRLSEHIDRFFHSASVIHMTPPYSKDEIINAIKDVLKENGLQSAYIRPLLYYAYGNLGLVPKACPVELVIGAWEWGAYLGDKADKGVSVFIVPWKRVHYSQLDMRAKLGGLYVQSTIAGLEARALGFDEAVFLNLEGHIAEGPGENIFLVKNNILRTNALKESILEGITRTSLLTIAQDIGIQTEIKPITREDFFSADEIFFTGTAVEVTPIIKVTDGSDASASRTEYVIGGGAQGKITMKLKALYKEIVSGKNPKYEKWLTYVS